MVLALFLSFVKTKTKPNKKKRQKNPKKAPTNKKETQHKKETQIVYDTLYGE